MLASFRQRINIKYFMVTYLGLLLLGASIAAGVPLRFFFGLVIVAIYAFFDLAWTRLRDHVWYLPVSSWISGLVLANVGPPAPSWWLLILLPLIAVGGKQLLHLGKSRHVFNPAGLSLFLMSLFTPVIFWWTASVNIWMLMTVGVVGLFILWRQQRFHIAGSFLIVYALGQATLAFRHGVNLLSVPAVLQPVVLNGPLLFFMTVMLIEPITSNFPTKTQRIIYGASVGLFSVLCIAVVSKLPIQNVDPLIFGLLLGNLVASTFFLPRAVPVANP